MEPDLDLRKVRYFVAVAERLHFGQAAAALHITQPALSRQIQQLERDLGVELFVRSSREVALTAAGEQFLLRGRQLLAVARTAGESARRAAAGDRALRVGFMLGMDTEPVLTAFSARRPGVNVLLQRLHWWEHGEAVLDGRVDVGFVRLPVADEGLELLPLYTEPINIALPEHHPMASEPALSIADVADEPVLHYADAIAAWNAFWCADPRPDGTQAHRGPAVHDRDRGVRADGSRRGLPPGSDLRRVPAARDRVRACHRHPARPGGARLARRPAHALDRCAGRSRRGDRRQPARVIAPRT